MRDRQHIWRTVSTRAAIAAALAIVLAAVVAPLPAAAQLLPEGFFDQAPTVGGQAQVEANMLSYNAGTSVISAEGAVILHYQGYALTAERVTFNQRTGEVWAEGNVAIRDPGGNVTRADRFEVTEGMKDAFIESLSLTTADGALIEATSVHYAKELESVLTDASYSPCGLCIDKKGRRIGWKVRASKIIYDRDSALVFLEGAGLEILGVPVAWVPWLVVPDPSQPRAQGFRTPSIDYKEEYGLRLDAPYFVPISEDMDLLLSPSLMSRQGFLMAAEWTHRVPWGTYDIKASGIYQLDPMAFSFPEAQTHWRGAIQTTGEFNPIEDWTVGWSYTAFTDAAYLDDYGLKSGDNVVNEIYATYLTQDVYLDARARQFHLLGDVTWAEQEQQTRAVPTIEAAKYIDLGEFGRIELSGELNGVQRGKDSYYTMNGVDYVEAYEENKLHATLEAAWQKQFILPAGVLATPYLGLRLDAGHFERSDPDLVAPYPTPTSGVSLLEATPIAAMDVRWPLIAITDHGSHLFEPVAQLVYRGSSTSLTGITNDNAQSFVFDDTLLFSYNRFSGSDRQETGLRANIGGRYLASFDDGSWLQLIGGKSYHLAGTNAFGIVDHAQTGNSTGLDNNLSYFVFGAQGSPGGGIELGAKSQFDAGSLSVMRATAAGSYSWAGYSVGASYTYIPANPAIGTLADQHEATVNGRGPLPWDYWYADGSVSWDIAQNTWLESTAGITYDDGYFVTGVFGKATGPTHSDPSKQTFGMKFRLRGPVGEWGF